MKVIKRTFIFGAVILFLSVFYFYIKPQDYRVTFTINTFAGTINQSIKAWHASINNSHSLNQKSLYELEQKLEFNDSIHTYRWKIIPKNDSISKVIVDVVDNQNSLSNRLALIKGSTAIEMRSKQMLLDFTKKLSEHIQQFQIHSFEEIDLPSTYYAYVTINGTQLDKAKGMMQSLPYLSSFLLENRIELNGSPFIEITHWNIDTDSISYNFCYPIKRFEHLPNHTEIKYKRFFAKRGIKVEYNGNYISSDRAWYALLDYARTNKLKVEQTPIEFFYNNPNMGGNELNWKVDVFIPLKQETTVF